MFIIEQVVSNYSRNSIQNTGEYHTKIIRFTEKNINNSLCCSAEEETRESGNKWDSVESSDFDSNSDSDFEPSSEETLNQK